jgi:hypothetical protein
MMCWFKTSTVAASRKQEFSGAQEHVGAVLEREQAWAEKCRVEIPTENSVEVPIKHWQRKIGKVTTTGDGAGRRSPRLGIGGMKSGKTMGWELQGPCKDRLGDCTILHAMVRDNHHG